jgi:hypothetical protein
MPASLARSYSGWGSRSPAQRLLPPSTARGRGRHRTGHQIRLTAHASDLMATITPFEVSVTRRSIALSDTSDELSDLAGRPSSRRQARHRAARQRRGVRLLELGGPARVRSRLRSTRLGAARRSRTPMATVGATSCTSILLRAPCSCSLFVVGMVRGGSRGLCEVKRRASRWPSTLRVSSPAQPRGGHLEERGARDSYAGSDWPAALRW